MNRLTFTLLSSSTLVGSLLSLVALDRPAQATEIVLDPLPNNTSSTPSFQNQLGCNRANCGGNTHLARFLQLFRSDDVESAVEDTAIAEANLEQNSFEDEELEPLLDFTVEESDAAIDLFGCDCIKSINALRQMRGNPIGVEGDIILPGPPIKPCNQPLS
ncbi:hypothetical protein [Roseofilum casamattae]|uniref:Uncharacterized protein n=1 Tax=Roseofilum casamattae BLCC-M143 TaxID=3022442 RepID=A0ABT7C2P0_9CYAN|nr:hypothetical protein [Roseofilum casamattae]MDJ1185730.1 hypothetical protein [Roseofilum casamattae BLCC-M143]